MENKNLPEDLLVGKQENGPTNTVIDSLEVGKAPTSRVDEIIRSVQEYGISDEDEEYIAKKDIVAAVKKMLSTAQEKKQQVAKEQQQQVEATVEGFLAQHPDAKEILEPIFDYIDEHELDPVQISAFGEAYWYFKCQEAIEQGTQIQDEFVEQIKKDAIKDLYEALESGKAVPPIINKKNKGSAPARKEKDMESTDDVHNKLKSIFNKKRRK